VNWKAARTSVALCALFVAIYGGTNYLTSLRAGVPSSYLDCERRIAFVPLMIVPYMSIDLLFVAAPFLCRDDRERRVLAGRTTAAILIAGACFLLFPLQFAFDRPHVGGPLGLIFNSFRAIDRPFNQFPSLHIALQIILLAVYVRHTHGMLRWLVCTWFALIAASTLLTYQHHVIDVLGGAVLGALCVHLFQDVPLAQRVLPDGRIAALYAGGAIALIVAAMVLHPSGLVLLWPAMSMGLIASAYVGVGTGVYRKLDGRLPWLSKLLLGPVLLGQRVSLAYYARQSPAWSAVTDLLWCGRKLSQREARQAVSEGVVAVLDLSGEFSEAEPFLNVAYRQLSALDLTAPTRQQLDEAVAFIDEHTRKGIVYVHCKAGYSRTAAVAGAYLLASGKATSVEEAVAVLRAARPGIVIRPEVRRALDSLKPAVAPGVWPSFAEAPSPGSPVRSARRW
jgi:hypothetical protein